jgi:hypothetical protein
MASTNIRYLQQQLHPQKRPRFNTISRENINDIQVTTLPIQIEKKMIEVKRRIIYKENKRNLTSCSLSFV